MSYVDDPGTESAGAIPPPPPPPLAHPVPAPAHPGSVPVSPVPGRHIPSKSRMRALTAFGAAFFVAVSAFAGYTIGKNNGSSSHPSSAAAGPRSSGSSLGSQSDGASGQNTAGIDANALANKLNTSIVNITTTLSGGEAAGTGIIISSSGLVLTNNHVIADSTSITVENAGDGSKHSAKVLGYDVVDDVALIQIQNVSSLTPAPIGDASSLSIGDTIVALGNAGGRGGSPSVVTGSITALDRQITASDPNGANAETLNNLIEVDANVQPGDSGGPLANTKGQVVGMNAAASAGNGGFSFSDQTTNDGYAIPIQHALTIAKKISGNSGGPNIHIGANRGVLGIAIQPDATRNSYAGRFGVNSDPSASGAVVRNVQSGSGAAAAGLTAGDVITAINGTSVNSATALTHTMLNYSPKDTVTVTWTDSSGSSHHASVVLGSGPPA